MSEERGDERGTTSLHKKDSTSIGMTNRPLEVVELLIQHGACVNAQDNCGFAPLRLACEPRG